MFLFIKYFFSSLFMCIMAAVAISIMSRYGPRLSMGSPLSPTRISYALTLAICLFIFMLLIFPFLLKIARKRNHLQKVTLAALHSTQLQVLKETHYWIRDKFFWILGILVMVAAAVAIIDSLR